MFIQCYVEYSQSWELFGTVKCPDMTLSEIEHSGDAKAAGFRTLYSCSIVKCAFTTY